MSCLPHPHSSTKGGLLYRVVEKGGVVTEQLVVPRPYVSKVLLGMDKTRDRILAHFYWPGVKRDVVRYCPTCPECQRTARDPRYETP